MFFTLKNGFFVCAQKYLHKNLKMAKITIIERATGVVTTTLNVKDNQVEILTNTLLRHMTAEKYLIEVEYDS